MEQDNPDYESCRIRPDNQISEKCISLNTLDRLDKLVIFAVIIMVIAGLTIIVKNYDQDGPTNSTFSRQAVVIISPEFDSKLNLTKTLLNTGNISKAKELIDSMIKDYPYDGRPYMLFGDLYVHQQKPVLAMLEYRKGIDLNPDFLDKKAKKLFRGKHIKNILVEARQVITAGLKKNPGDPQLKQQLETLYYMLRRVAGSCG